MESGCRSWLHVGGMHHHIEQSKQQATVCDQSHCVVHAYKNVDRVERDL